MTTSQHVEALRRAARASNEKLGELVRTMERAFAINAPLSTNASRDLAVASARAVHDLDAACEAQQAYFAERAP